MKRGRSRKKNQRTSVYILIAACLVLILGIIVVWNLSEKKRPDDTSLIFTSNDAVETPMGETMLEETAEPVTTKSDSAGTLDTETKVPETMTESPYLKDLSGIDPGVVLDDERIDFGNLSEYFMSWKIEEGDTFYKRINGKSYQINEYVPLHSLRYLKMPHYNFNGDIQVGEMIVGEEVMEDVIHIFQELFEAKYPIYSMYLIDNYWTGDPDTSDYASIDVNNTSAFCYRQVTGGGKLSNHAYGKAIDLNPMQNPYVSYSNGTPKWAHSNANDYINRTTGLSHVITHEDFAYQVFTKYGFQWGGDWSNPKDYQHFDKN